MNSGELKLSFCGRLAMTTKPSQNCRGRYTQNAILARKCKSKRGFTNSNHFSDTLPEDVCTSTRAFPSPSLARNSCFSEVPSITMGIAASMSPEFDRAIKRKLADGETCSTTSPELV